MATADERIRLLLEARNNAAGALNQVQQQMQGLNKAAGIAAAGMGAIASAAAINGIVQLGGAIYDLAQNAANFAAVRNSFEGLAAGVGQNADQMLTSMRNASQGMVSDANLVLSANRAMLLGVADTGEEMGTLLEIARVRGRAMGLDVSQAFNDIVTGLGRMSPMILDNLGITVDMEGATAKYAQTLGTTSAKLTDAQRKQALLNEVIESSKGLLEGNAGEGDAMAASFERAQASIDNMKLALGELFSPAVAAVAEAIANAANSAREMSTNVGDIFAAPSIEETLAAQNKRRTDALALIDQMAGAQPELIRQAYELLQMADDLGVSMAEVATYGFDPMAVALANAVVDANEMQVAIRQTGEAALQLQRAGEAQSWVAAGAVAAAELQAQMDAAAASAANFNSVLALIRPNIDGLSDNQINNLATNAAMLFDSLVAGDMSSADALKEVKRQLDVVIPALNGTNSAARAAASGISTLGQVAPGAASGVSTIGIEAARAAVNLGILKGALDNLAGVQVLEQAQDIFADFQNTQDARSGWADVRQELRRVGDEGASAAKSGAALNQTMYMAYNNTRAMGGAASTVNREFETLKSTVAGLLQGQLTMPGVDIENILPRPDAINENARRLAAIANEGLIGQDWFGEFAAEVPDIAKMLQESGDPRAAAAQLLADFQDGLVPQLLDPEAAKEKVRRMILGDQNMAAMAQQIAQELSQEMGISLQQAQQATGTALGLSKDGEAGTSVLDGNNEGNRFVDGVSQVLASRQQEFLAEGSNAGGQWGTGFLASVRSGLPAALIAILIAAVRSGLADDADAQGSRTGAR